jgi:hypothetical protein
MLIGGVWLLGLGIVFLVKEATNLEWAQAWPMFVVLVGVATFVSTALAWRPSLTGLWAFTWPVVTIVVGSVLLASTTGSLEQGPAEWLEAWWPAIAIGLGVWFLIGAVIPDTTPVEQLSLPLGDVSAASVWLSFGGGILDVAKAPAGALVDGTFSGGVLQRSDGPGRVHLSQDTRYGLPWLDHEGAWRLGVTGEVPLELKLETGATKTTLDLSDLLLRRLDLQTGASETRVRLPRAAGATDVRASAGVASVTIEVPTGVAARIRSKMALGSSQVDEARFPRTFDGYISPDFEGAANRVDITIEGGVGSVKVVSAA